MNENRTIISGRRRVPRGACVTTKRPRLGNQGRHGTCRRRAADGIAVEIYIDNRHRRFGVARGVNQQQYDNRYNCPFHYSSPVVIRGVLASECQQAVVLAVPQLRDPRRTLPALVPFPNPDS